MMESHAFTPVGAAHGDTLGDAAVVLLRGENALVSVHGAQQQLREAPELVRTEDEVDHG